MSSTLVTNIGFLDSQDDEIGVRSDAAFIFENDVITWLGAANSAPAADTQIDVAGRTVLPGFVDSHAHLVFAGDRAHEFAARMAGETYSAGGIASTVNATRAATDAELRSNVERLVNELNHSGTTTFEIKSGYGLTTHDEERSLRIAAEFTTDTTYLGAHVVPAEFADDPAGYVELVTGKMLDACAPHAKWIDVFCDRGAFDVDQARAILQAGIARGLQPRIHANQLQHGAGVQLAVELGAASADHCTHLDQVDIDALADSQTVATLLPGAEFSTRSPYPDAKRLLDSGVIVAIATDCNPGSSFTTSMPFAIAIAVREMGMTPAQAIRAATVGGAAALRRTDVGHLAPGMRADFVTLNAPDTIHLAYRPGVDLIDQVWQAGTPLRKAA
jgi:imidazolonepropionase